MGVVVVHRPPRAVARLPAVHDLLPQVDELLVVRNGDGDGDDGPTTAAGFRLLDYPVNRGTAAAWNAALGIALDSGHRFLYLLDQDSEPDPDAVATARAAIEASGAAAVVQPPSLGRVRLDPFPWDTVASGSLLDVAVLCRMGGFDERLFVDEVDHELFDRLLRAGYSVRPLPAPTITHRVGAPHEIRLLGRTAWASGHGVDRRRLQGYSAGLLVRRYLAVAPATSVRLLLRHALTAAKDTAAGEKEGARALVSGLLGGVAATRPPARAADRACPYCEGPLVGRFAAVPDWRFNAAGPSDVYRCADCGALGAGRVPSPAELASWYSDYYTHAPEPVAPRAWSRLWPLPVRRREMERMRCYLSSPGEKGRLLEVGTGAGERLVEFADAGWEVVGQDPDPKAGRLARSRGIVVHRCPVDDLVGREQPFDLIGLTHALEHAVEPAELLRSCASLLAPGGRICVIAPNAQALGRLLFGRWWFGLEQPRHLAIPTLDSLEQVRRRLGLQVADARTVPTNAAVILGGSLDRPLQRHLAPGPLRGAARASMALLGQALGRAAVRLHPRLGEEIVWVGHHPA